MYTYYLPVPKGENNITLSYTIQRHHNPIIAAIHTICSIQYYLPSASMRYSAIIFTIAALITGQALAVTCDCELNGICMQDIEDVNFDSCKEMCGNIYAGGGQSGRGRSVYTTFHTPFSSPVPTSE